MTRLGFAAAVCLQFVFLGPASAQNLLTNGDFEQALSVGWTQAQGGSGTHIMDRSQSYYPDPDFEAMAYQCGNPGWTRLSQTVEVSGVGLRLTFWARFEEGDSRSTCWAAACFCVCYYDAGAVLLGETRFYYSTYADWVPSSTLSLVRVTDSTWNQYTLDIADELSQNLPGVDPARVARVEVASYAYGHAG